MPVPYDAGMSEGVLLQLAQGLRTAKGRHRDELVVEFRRLLRDLPGPWNEIWHGRWTTAFSIRTGNVLPEHFVAVVADLLMQGKGLPVAVEVIKAALTAASAQGTWYVCFSGPILKRESREAVPLGASAFVHAPTPEVFPPSLPKSARPVTACFGIKAMIRTPFRSGPATEHDNTTDGDGRLRKASEAIWESYRRIEALVALTLHPRPLYTIGGCFLFDDLVLRHLSPSADFYWYEDAPPARQLFPFVAVEPQQLTEWWAALDRMERGHAQSLLTACDRIRRGAREVNDRDALVEACIALEALFGDTSHDGATYKVRKRCARFLRTGVEERTKLDKLLNDAMNARGLILHGRSSEPVDSGMAAQLLSIAVEAARAFLARPVWPSPNALDFE